MHDKTIAQALSELGVNSARGISQAEERKRAIYYGENCVRKKPPKRLIMRVLEAFCEPMLIILLFALALAVGVNVGKIFKGGEGDIIECIGIFFAVVLSVAITVVMEGRSQRAFEMLSKYSSSAQVRVRRDGEVKIIPKSKLVVGDVVILSGGDKIPADCRLIFAEDFLVDESSLTGESLPRKKRHDVSLATDTPLAERVNCVFGGTFAISGRAEGVVVAVGSRAEMGKIAGELADAKRASSPLQEKLARLGKAVAVIGGVVAVAVFAVTAVRLIVSGSATFEDFQQAFLDSVVLIVAAVPEGLPTIVALSLSINVIKLARDNALVKKLVVAETAGCVSVICSDKTGTLTTNKMQVVGCFSPDGKALAEAPVCMVENSLYNNSLIDVSESGEVNKNGSATELAIYEFAQQAPCFSAVRGANIRALSREAFTSEKKYMSTKTHKNGSICNYYKGAIEKICALSGIRVEAGALAEAQRQASLARRVIAFARVVDGTAVFDGFVAIADTLREDVKDAVSVCSGAGVRVMMLTGDNPDTALAIAREAGIATHRGEVALGEELDRLSPSALCKRLPSLRVVARSTPMTKLKVVEALQSNGEVVAVTGDGINDAPAVKRADMGVAMGSGTDVTKEAADIVLLDDSFSTIVRAISFGRNVYRSFRRFITFQLTVNFSAVLIVLACLFAGMQAPFSALQLLWINMIMDGPPALSLGFERASKHLMKSPPLPRSANLVDAKMCLRIAFACVFTVGLVMAQASYDVLGAGADGVQSATFSLFVILQIFNAVNCREVGSQSALPSLSKNKPFVLAFVLTVACQVIITQFAGRLFGTHPLTIRVWGRIFLAGVLLVAVTECFKLIYRLYLTLNAKKHKKTGAGRESYPQKSGFGG